MKNSIKAIELKLNEEKKEKEEKKALKEQKQVEFEQSHLFFKLKDKLVILKGYVFDNAFIISSYTANGYIVVVPDSQGKCFISVNTRIKEGKKTNSGSYLAKDQLLSKEKSIIIENLKAAFSDDFQTALNKVKNTPENQFKRTCTNKRCITLVEKVSKFASKYNLKKEN